MAIVIERENPDQPEVRAFFAASEAYMAALYPAESNHFIDFAALSRPEVVFLVARQDGVSVGCGALVPAGDGTAEIKRMWVDPGCRGQRLGLTLLDGLVRAGHSAGYAALQLETGIAQPEALGLYRRAGFVEREPFGSYAADPLSVFMELRLIPLNCDGIAVREPCASVTIGLPEGGGLPMCPRIQRACEQQDACVATP